MAQREIQVDRNQVSNIHTHLFVVFSVIRDIRLPFFGWRQRKEAEKYLARKAAIAGGSPATGPHDAEYYLRVLQVVIAFTVGMMVGASTMKRK